MEINNITASQQIIKSQQAPNLSLKAELDHLRDEFRTLLCKYHNNPSPENLTKLSAFMYQMRDFLESHKEEIFAEAKRNGWVAISPMGTKGGYEHCFNSTILTIDTFLNPTYGHIKGNLDYINEQFTQLTWLFSHGQLMN